MGTGVLRVTGLSDWRRSPGLCALDSGGLSTLPRPGGRWAALGEPARESVPAALSLHFPLDNFRERVRARPQTSSRACASSPAARQETRIRLRRLETHPAPWRPARSIPGPRKVAAYIVGMEPTRSLEQLTDGELLLRLADILRQSRRNEADLVAHIAEVDARRLYAREASPSMFAYCTERLHLSEAEAYLRIAAARASREHPILLAMLADGRLHLTAIAKLAPHLTPDNRDAVLKRATHCSKRQVEELAAELAPRPDAPALIRKLPEPPPIAPSPTSGRPRPDRIAGSSFELRPDAVAPQFEGGHAVAPSEPGLGRDKATGSSAELRPDGVGQSVSHPPRLPRRASSRSPPGATASSSPPAPGCATSSRGSRRSCAPPSPAPTSPPSSKTPSPRSSKGSRPAASVSRRPPARTSRRPRRSPPRATSLPPSAGPCTSGTGAVVASSTSRADGARPATGSSTTTATPLPWVATTPRRGSPSRAKPTTCTWRRSTSGVRPWPGIGGRARGERRAVEHRAAGPQAASLKRGGRALNTDNRRRLVSALAGHSPVRRSPPCHRNALPV